jgi:hypothetical protein
MAQLTLDSLLDCNFIPDFIPANTRAIFNNTDPPVAPTSWTKDLSHNNKALRVTTASTVSPGGSLTFTQVFPTTNKAVQGTLTASPASVSVNQLAVGSLSSGQINAITQSPISIQNATLSESQIAAHSHQAQRFPDNDSIGSQATEPGVAITGRELNTRSTNNPPGPTSHNHTVPGGTQHAHGVTATQHSHTITNAGSHSHPFTTTSQNFNILYVDVIIAVKA